MDTVEKVEEEVKEAADKVVEVVKDPMSLIRKPKRAFGRFMRILGPGIITGAADDDPSGIATYSQTGAKFGYGQLWTAFWMLPFMISIQEACARIGASTGKGLAAIVKEKYSRTTLYFVVFLVVAANTINISADIAAISAATYLIFPIPMAVLAILFTLIILVLEVFVPYKKYVKILKWLTLSLLAYPVTMFMVSQPWGEIAAKSFIPNIQLNFEFLFIITGVLGTTISPYMFFWQTSQEIEEEKTHHLIAKDGKPNIDMEYIKDIRKDTIFGMVWSNFTTWTIIIVGATVLNANGITNIDTAADAAKALEPLVQTFPNAGMLAKIIFAVGIFGLGVLAIPVLAGSASYAMSEAFGWKEGLNLKLKQAYGFYGVIIGSTVIGMIINLIGIDPVKTLIFAAVVNGVVAVPLIYYIAKIARDEKVMGKYRSGWLSNTFVWLTFVAMGLAALAMFYTLILGS